MSNETSKATRRRLLEPGWSEIFKGRGIDIGSGGDLLDKSAFPSITSIEGFDLEDGDAQYIHLCREENSYDFVHSSQCLEHMRNAKEALKNWIKIVKPGGYLVVTIPDYTLYEHRTFPSKWNHDHKFCFSIDEKVDRPEHITVREMLATLPDVRVVKLDLIDTNYDYSVSGVDQTRGEAEAFIEFVLQKL